MRFAALVMLAGCTMRTTTATPSELAVHGPEFTEQGRAELLRPQGNVTVSADERVNVRILEGEGLQRSATLTVRELVAGCRKDGPDGECLARRVFNEPVLRHHERHVDGDAVAKLVGISAIGGMVGYCAAECQGDGDLERGFAYTGAFVGGTLLLGFILIAVVGGHD